jgi:hypothetical protein
VEAVAFTDHLVSAALGDGSAPARTQKSVAPPNLAARARRRLEFNEKALELPQALITTDPTGGDFSDSSPIMRRLFIFGALTSKTLDESIPISSIPTP